MKTHPILPLAAIMASDNTFASHNRSWPTSWERALAHCEKRDKFPGDCWVVQQQAPKFVDRRSPYGNSALRPRRVFGCSGATQSGAKEVPRSQRRRGERSAVIVDPRDGHLTIAHTKDSSPGIALPLDRAAVPNRHNPSRRTVATAVFWWNSCQKPALLQLIRLQIHFLFRGSSAGLT